MSTNGQITFIAGSHAKRSYCHWDSYPSGLGLTVLSWLRRILSGQLELTEPGTVATRQVDDETSARRAVKALVVVSDFGYGYPPTPDQESALAKFKDESVGGGQEQWYRLLRATQGQPAAILEAGYTYDQLYGDEGGDEHYNYIVDFDKRELRILSHTWSFDTLPTDSEFEKAFGEEWS